MKPYTGRMYDPALDGPRYPMIDRQTVHHMVMIARRDAEWGYISRDQFQQVIRHARHFVNKRLSDEKNKRQSRALRRSLPKTHMLRDIYGTAD